MIQKILLLIAPMIASVVAVPARAEFVDGNQLHQWCTATEADTAYYQQNASCRAYVLGALDDFRLEMELAGMPRCIPSNSTRGQMADVVTKYLRNHPETRQMAAAVIVRFATVEAFGCSLTRTK